MAVTMAVHVLLDHGVKEENICVGIVLASLVGLSAFAANFPKIRIVVAAVANNQVGGDENSSWAAVTKRLVVETAPIL